MVRVKEESENAGLKLHIQKTKIMAKRWGKKGNSGRFYFGGSNIIADDECSYKIKICLLLGRKAMTNLDNVLKSRDITLSTKVCIVKAMIFPVVMHTYERWATKKAER